MLNRRVALVTAVASLVLALAGCDSDTEAKSGAADGPSVIAPGMPGEANSTLSAEEAADRRAEDDTPNSADVAYARQMIEHHAQALEMTRLVPDRARSGDVKRLALRISASQQPEIETMRGWLTTHGKSETADAHTHDAMPGMATAAQLDKLRAAEGKAFDDLFLTLMIAHHEGAITMATDVKAQGNNLLIEEMADDVVAQQTSEINRMRRML
ncbi:DUF305 domain-containing protein [Streptomyces antibioticus]|uniref:DUF305 domain-containing protein n=1 Tax=Streptomyces antibioticus TaxID=1890 RepID=UPI0036CF8B0B